MFSVSAALSRSIAAVAVFWLYLGTVPGKAQDSAPASKHTLVLTWSDEFNGPDGSAPDPAKWHVISSGSGNGNDELQYYTRRPINVHQEGGNLVIMARKEHYKGREGVRKYTSARLETLRLFAQKYGRMEARIKLPGGQGIWPAFWMMGNDVKKVGWPACGEIDIMEQVGFEPSMTHGTLHAEGYSGPTALGSSYTLPDRGRFSDGFHRFAVEWEPGEIRFYADDVLFATRKQQDIPADAKWPFDHPFYLLLNVAVGGHWPGAPDKTTRFPATMLVDYVRVYRFAEMPASEEVKKTATRNEGN
ncbi:MAG: glycoside hydrolase family 16 protein [Terracidiphilus sp.]|nr:glycoside hydrolase family 16 protein [Terracidiphilus sp.]